MTWLSLLIVALAIPLLEGPACSSQSTITEAEGYACMGYDKSRKQTEEEALSEARKKAAEYASTYIQSETQVENFQLKKDLIEAYARATVKTIQELEQAWVKDASAGECFKVRIKAEVIPDEKAMAKWSKMKEVRDHPSAPLHVQVWTEKEEYRSGEKIKIFLRGNKPFFARVLYRDAKGELLQLLPNPYRKDNYFDGGTIYEIPSGKDQFELDVTPPFGEENIILYASSSPLGDISLQSQGSLFRVMTDVKTAAEKTRGITIKEKGTEKKPGSSDFFEASVTVRTK